MVFINFENFEKIGLKIAIIAPKSGVFYRFFGPDRAYPDFTENLELVFGKWLNWSKNC